MMSKKPIGKNRLGYSAVAWVLGIGISILITLLLTAGLTGLIITGRLQESTSKLITATIRTVAVFSGCMITTSIKREKILQNTGIVTAAYTLIMLGLGIILYDGSFHSFGLGILSVLIGGIVAYLIRMKPNKRKHISRRIR